MPRRKPEQLKQHDFKALGSEALSRIPVSVKLPPELDKYVRSLPNRNQWMIAAIAAQVEREISQQEGALSTARACAPCAQELPLKAEMGS